MSPRTNCDKKSMNCKTVDLPEPLSPIRQLNFAQIEFEFDQRLEVVYFDRFDVHRMFFRDDLSPFVVSSRDGLRLGQDVGHLPDDFLRGPVLVGHAFLGKDWFSSFRYSLSPTKSVNCSKLEIHWVWPGRMPAGAAFNAVKKSIRALWATMQEATGIDTRPTPIRASSGTGTSSVFMPEMASIKLTESGPSDVRDGPFDVGPRLDPVDECQVGAGGQITVATLDGFIQAADGEHVGPGVDDKVLVQAVPGVRAGPDLASHFLGRDHLFAGHVAAPLGKHLVLDVHSGRAHLNQPLGDPGGIHGVAAARIDVGHHRNGDGLDDVPGHVQNVFIRTRPMSGLPEKLAARP